MYHMISKKIKDTEFRYENGKLYREHHIKNNKKLRGWYCVNDNCGCRARPDTSINGRKYLVSRLVYKFHNPEWNIDDYTDNNMIDHIDRNPFNNSIENLRVLDRRQNCLNNNAKGVKFDKRSKKYEARICINYKYIHLGTYTTYEEAKKVYEKEKQKHLL